MINNDKHVKWQNGIQNHQNGEPLPVLDPQIEGYKPVELFQWEMRVQFYSQRASTQSLTADIGDKIKSLVIKLQEMHKKDKILLFTKKGARINIETFPKKAAEVYGILSMAAAQPDYQDQINKLLDAVAEENHEQDPKICEMHQTTSEFAKYHIHLQMGKVYMKVEKQKYKTKAIRVFVRQPFSLIVTELMQEIAPMISLKSEVKFVLSLLKYNQMIKNNVEHNKMLIREQNAYLTKYADFCIGGVSEAMLDVN
eukprot:8059318-Ditylum_brightwellii.AAC.1